MLTGTLDMMNGVRDLDREIELLQQDIAAVNPDFGGPWTLDNLAQARGEASRPAEPEVLGAVQRRPGGRRGRRKTHH